MTKLTHKVTSKVTCAPDEKLCMVDSGAFTRAIDHDVEVSDIEIPLVPFKNDEKGVDGGKEAQTAEDFLKAVCAVCPPCPSL